MGKVIAINKRLAVKANNKAYGYWITSEGKVEPVDHQKHNNYAHKYILNTEDVYPDFLEYMQKHEDNDELDYVFEELGWARLAYQHAGYLSIEFAKNRLNRQAFLALSKFLRDTDDDKFYHEYYKPWANGEIGKFTSDELTEKVNEMRKNIRKDKTEAILSRLELYQELRRN